MPWIKVILESESDGELKDAYAKMREVNLSYEGLSGTQPPMDAQSGVSVVGPPTLSSLSPKAMLHARELMMEIMRGPSRLTPAQREMIATVTSFTSNCRY